MANRLALENSPYLLQHANNPVDWYPWAAEALSRARTENKPIFLSIGYSACHWCHVMEHESFEDPEIASILNHHFVPIKVDREERPDLDAVYMEATNLMTGSGGWPMSVFLTPDLQPFYAGTYFPPSSRYGKPGFGDVLRAVAQAWQQNPGNLRDVAAKVTARLREPGKFQSPDAFDEQALESASEKLIQSYDWEHGGWGAAPKFPQPLAIDFLLRRSARAGAPSEAPRAPLHALRSMARGGMYDTVGGGFSRYSTDPDWRVPHFEKMLYDNAQLARTYLHAWQLTGDPFFETILLETVDFVERELTGPGGEFYSSLDADSDGSEGKFYTWSPDEIRTALADNDLYDLFASAYGLTGRANSEDRLVLQRALDDDTVAARLTMTRSEAQARLSECRARLLHVRNLRPRPATDDKVLASWNGLMLRTLAESGTMTQDISRRQRLVSMATRNATFLRDNLFRDGRLRHTWRRGKTGDVVFLEDLASLVLAYLQLYQTDFNETWFDLARELADDMIARFSNPDGGFFDTPSDGPAMLLRPQELEDSSTPSGNAMAVEALLELVDLDGNERHRELAISSLRLMAGAATSYPLGFAAWLSAADRAIPGSTQVAIVYPEHGSAQALLDAIRKRYRPNLVLVASKFPPSRTSPVLLQDRSMQGGHATAFVCREFVCSLPVVSPEELERLLNQNGLSRRKSPFST